MISSSNNAAVAASKIASAASSQLSGENKSTNNNNNNNNNSSSMVECGISIDTTNYAVDVPQQDSGSNQSGSDSGLGYANSLSSDNSSITNTITTLAAASGQVESLLAKGKNNITSNSNFLNAVTKNNNNTNKNETSSINKLESASTCTKKIHHHLDANEEFVVVDEINGSRIEPDTKLNNRQTIFKSKDNPVGDVLELPPPPTIPTSTELATSSSSPPHHHHPPPHQAVLVPVLKSLLKKPSPPHLTSSNNAPRRKHNRNVSFNQTVIVFCEEIGAPSPDGELFQPPLGYQDTQLGSTTNSDEPPDDYCDHKANERRVASVTNSEPSSVIGLDKNDGFDNRDAYEPDAASNLTDDQLIGLLENDTLLETFKLSCDDFSEDDFPINHLNSNHGFLCNDAISDYDSDSESSFCIDTKNSRVSTLQSPVARTQPNLITNASSNLQQAQKHRATSRPESNPVKQPVEKFSNYDSSNMGQPITTKPNPQKSMPARMKVSTVDTSHSRRHSNRQEDHYDHKAKLDSCLNNSRSYEQDQPQHSTSLKTNQHEINCARPAPMLIKQMNLEPVSLSKSVLISNCTPNSNPVQSLSMNSSIHELLVAPQTSSASISTDRLSDDRNQVQERASVQQNSNCTDTQMKSAEVIEPTAQSCQICRVIESSKPKDQADSGNFVRQDESSQTKANNIPPKFNPVEPNQVQPPQSIVAGQRAIFTQTCVSCREALIHQQSSLRNDAPAQPVGGAQQIRPPAAYQLVYVVDSKGNRIRALSMVRAAPRDPLSSSAGVHSLPDRRFFIAHDGVRFPNPVSVGNQIVSSSNQQQQQTPHLQWAQNSLRCNNTQHYRVIGSIQAQDSQPQQNQYIQNAGNGVRPPTYVSAIQRVIPTGRPRQHTVYYVRQPLDTQNVFDSTGSNSRSFPDPHEIRRLDGLRGPTSAINISNKIDPSEQAKTPVIRLAENNQLFGDSSKQILSSARDEVDDPTFGFSKRPSVKVVATNSNLSNSNTLSNRNNSRIEVHNSGSHSNTHPNNLVAIRRLPGQPGNVRPVSLVVMRSQTLDRRNIVQQSQQQSMKENIPSTSSMSNIHGAYMNLPTNKVSIHQSQQPRISSGMESAQENFKSKDTIASESRDIHLEGNKNVILNHGRAPLVATQVRQQSNLSAQNLASERNNRRNQEKSEVAYSMNI